MTSRPDVLVICPSRSPIARSTASLRRVPWGGFPDFIGTISGLRLLVLHPAALRCLRLAVPPCCPCPLPRAGTTPGSLDCFYRGARAASSRWRKRGLPGSWTTLAYMPRSQTPADRLHLANSVQPMLPSANLTASAPHQSLSRLNHAAYRLPVYASQPGSPPHHATLGTGGWPTLAGTGLSPAGSQRRFPSCLSVYMTSPLTKLCLAQ